MAASVESYTTLWHKVLRQTETPQRKEWGRALGDMDTGWTHATGSTWSFVPKGLREAKHLAQDNLCLPYPL